MFHGSGEQCCSRPFGPLASYTPVAHVTLSGYPQPRGAHAFPGTGVVQLLPANTKCAVEIRISPLLTAIIPAVHWPWRTALKSNERTLASQRLGRHDDLKT